MTKCNNNLALESLLKDIGKQLEKQCNKTYIDTCFLPDQYAVQWTWAGDGSVRSFDPITQEWTNHGITTFNGSTVGGFALAFKNDTIDPVLYFQRSGKLYKASPSDPIGTFAYVGDTLPAAPSSYPCFAFDPSGRLLAGIGGGSTVIEIDPDTGAATNIGSLIDVRDGAKLSAGPGDWYFDPNGQWFMMARDNRGAMFSDSNGDPLCTGTVLWKIDPATLEAVRVSDSCSPVAGTGAEWLNAGVALLSHGDGSLSQYNIATDEWSAFPQDSGGRINDLSAEWIIPEAVRVVGVIDKGSAIEDCSACLMIVEMDENNIAVCRPFDIILPGQFGKCETTPNPFVSDPFSDTGSDSGPKNPDQVWNEGCSAAGTTYYRTSCDVAGNEFTQYLYGSLAAPIDERPNNFKPTPCFLAENVQAETTEWCNLDVVPATSVFRKERRNGSVVWFDESGIIPEPVLKEAGSCENLDPLLPVTEQIICFEGANYVRKLSEQYIENADGLPELTSYQIIWYNEDGTFYDSTQLTANDVAEEPSGYYLGDCSKQYQEVIEHKLCEVDAEYLLLIDSGGAFARYSYATQTWTTVSTLSVASAGGSADYDNFRLYAFTGGDQLTTVDVNTDTVLPTITLTDGVINPAVATNPKTFSAASFRNADQYLYAWDTGGADAGLYKVDVTTGVVDFVTPITGVVGTGTSIAIDNTTDTLIVNGSTNAYQVDWVTGVGTQWATPPIRANGSTFDASGNYYVTSNTDTYCLPAGADGNNSAAYTQIIDDWSPGANSLAYYRVKAAKPSCFIRRFGVLEDGSAELIGDFNVLDNSERTVVGEVDCCECACSDSGSSVYTGPSAEDIALATVEAQRNSVEGKIGKFGGNTVQSLPVAAGQRGNLLSVLDSGTGLVYFTTDGSAPSNTGGANRGEATGPYHTFNLTNVDLSQLRFAGSSTASDYTVIYECYV